MIRMTLQDRPHECAAGERPCECKLYALVTEAGDVVPCPMPEPGWAPAWRDQGEAHRAVERAARAARQREGQAERATEIMREVGDDLASGRWHL